MSVKTRKISLQELAEFMRDVAYGDNQSHHIVWSLRVVHPKTTDGDVGFVGGLWTDPTKVNTDISVSFSYSETKGIYNFRVWKEKAEVRYSFDGTPMVEEFKETVIKLFSIKQLFEHL